MLTSINSQPGWLRLENTPTAFQQRGKALNKFPRYGIKQSDGEAPVIMEFWGM